MNFVQLKGKVELKPYEPRKPISREYMADAEIVGNGTLVLDTELYSNYWLCLFRDIHTHKIIKIELPFDERKLSWILQNYRTVGFNSNKYDLPIIWAAIKNQNIQYLKEISDAVIYRNAHPKALQEEFGFKIFPTNTIDLMAVCPLKGSLKLYGARLHSKRIQDLPIDVNSPLADSNIPIVLDYCCNDLDITELLFNNLQEQLELREDLSIQYKTDLMSKSDAQIAESVIGAELKQITGKWPKKPEINVDATHKFRVPTNLFFQTPYMQKVLNEISKANFTLDNNGRLIVPKAINNFNVNIGTGTYRLGIGGLHSSEESIAIKADADHVLIDKDVASYYPRIVLNLGLYPQHLGENFLKVYKSLVDRRLYAKKIKNVAVAECLKITINGTFGKTGSPYSFLYSPGMTIQITVGGQLYLLVLIERLELAGISVVSANTDGIVIKCPKALIPIMNEIVRMWEQITGFETEETEYEALYSRDVNAYLAVKSNKSTKGKNRYYDPWKGTSAKDRYWRFQANPTVQICTEALEQLICHGVRIEKTITECTDITRFVAVRNVAGGAHKDFNYLGKVVRWYYAKNVVGTINYITSNNKVPDTEGAKPLMDLPDAFPLDVDYQWYINKTTEMLYDIAYLNKPKQQVLF